MGAALFIVLQREVEGVNASSVGGKFLSRNMEMLDALANKLKVEPLGNLISINPKEASEFLEGEGVNDEGLSLPPERWFDPGEGLRTVTALLTSLSSTQSVDARLLEDLKSCERVLTAAQNAGVSFHFAVDF
jgi:hypothetical protein